MKKIFLIIVLLMSPIFAQKNTTLLFNSEDAITDTGITIKTNLVAYWAMEDTTDSYSTNELTNSGVTFASGKVNNCGIFVNTEDDYLYTGNNAALDVSGSVDFTIAHWYYLAVPAVTMGLVSQASTTSTRMWYTVYSSGDSDPGFSVSADGTNITSTLSSGINNVTTWIFLVAWRNTNTDSIYFQINNGTIYQTAFNNTIYDGNNTIYIGRLFGNSAANDMYGRIDEVGFWKRCLTAGERTYLYNNGTGRTYTDGKIQ